MYSGDRIFDGTASLCIQIFLCYTIWVFWCINALIQWWWYRQKLQQWTKEIAKSSPSFEYFLNASKTNTLMQINVRPPQSTSRTTQRQILESIVTISFLYKHMYKYLNFISFLYSKAYCYSDEWLCSLQCNKKMLQNGLINWNQQVKSALICVW